MRACVREWQVTGRECNFSPQLTVPCGQPIKEDASRTLVHSADHTRPQGSRQDRQVVLWIGSWTSDAERAAHDGTVMLARARVCVRVFFRFSFSPMMQPRLSCRHYQPGGRREYRVLYRQAQNCATAGQGCCPPLLSFSFSGRDAFSRSLSPACLPACLPTRVKKEQSRASRLVDVKSNEQRRRASIHSHRRLM